MKSQTVSAAGKKWMFAVVCMFTALMCHIEWSHINTRRCIAAAIECIDIRVESLLGRDISGRLPGLRAKLDSIGDYSNSLTEAMPFIKELLK